MLFRDLNVHLLWYRVNHFPTCNVDSRKISVLIFCDIVLVTSPHDVALLYDTVWYMLFRDPRSISCDIPSMLDRFPIDDVALRVYISWSAMKYCSHNTDTCKLSLNV